MACAAQRKHGSIEPRCAKPFAIKGRGLDWGRYVSDQVGQEDVQPASNGARATTLQARLKSRDGSPIGGSVPACNLKAPCDCLLQQFQSKRREGK